MIVSLFQSYRQSQCLAIKPIKRVNRRAND
jgi:hypothetical protein